MTELVNGVAVSGKGLLPCKKCIIHMVAPKSADVKLWTDVIIECLREAEKRKLESIAFPAVGTGNSSY